MTTLIQKRALAALNKNLKEAERAHAQAYNSYSVAMRLLGPNHPSTKATARREYAARAGGALPRILLKNLERKLGLSGNNNYSTFNANVRRQTAARKIQSAYRRYRPTRRTSPKRSPYTPRSMRRIPRTNLN
jgi:hypothetical protein